MPRSADHIVWDTSTGGHTFRCDACGDRYEWNLPVSVNVIALGAKGYLKAHRGCRKRYPLFGPKEWRCPQCKMEREHKMDCTNQERNR